MEDRKPDNGRLRSLITLSPRLRTAAHGRSCADTPSRVVCSWSPYNDITVRRWKMEIAATLTSKGQLTVPKAVRDALGLKEGDQVIFRVLEGRAVVARSPSLLDLAGAVPVPTEARGAAWSEIRRRARVGLYRG